MEHKKLTDMVAKLFDIVKGDEDKRFIDNMILCTQKLKDRKNQDKVIELYDKYFSYGVE